MDEYDLQLLNLLQIAPRISWAAAADVLGSSPGTVAAHWRRLRSEGLAWIAVHPNDPGSDRVVTAFVDVDSSPGGRYALGRELCADGRVVSVEECGRGRDLLLTVMVPDLDALSRFVLDELSARPSVMRTRTSVATEIFADGSAWRLDALDAGQLRAVAATRGAETPAVSGARGASEDWPLIEVLTADARTSVSDLARASGRNPATARRQLGRLLSSDRLTFRCDMAYRQAGWPVACSWLARVPPADLAHAVAELRRLRQLRLCARITGEANLVLTMFSRSVRELGRLEQVLGERLPNLVLQESMLHLRPLKRMGWILDASGRCTGEVVTPTVFSP